MTPPPCDVCGAPQARGVAPWHFTCGACGTESSSSTARIGEASAPIHPDEAGRAVGLRALRQEGYVRLLRSLRRLRQGTGGRLLEVGSAHGWFLEAARQDFDEAVGVEPDGDVRSEPESCQVRAGFFPAAVAPGERFDVIAFNDVFEHIRPTADVAEAVANALSPGGIAMINLPMASGGIYRLTALLHRCGLRSPFERMWQIEFPSPHLYYFSARGLRQLFASRGLELVSEIDMPTLRAKGLWQRIRHAEPNLPVAIASYVGSLAALPVQQLLPADVKCLFFRAPER